jgi:hypothetical protein
MITLIISTCLTAALTDCKVTQRLPMPASMTMVGCNQVAATMLDEKTGPLIIPDKYKTVTCERS